MASQLGKPMAFPGPPKLREPMVMPMPMASSPSRFPVPRSYEPVLMPMATRLATRLRLWLPSLASQWDSPGPRGYEPMSSMPMPMAPQLGFPVGFPGLLKFRAHAYACVYAFPAGLPSGFSRAYAYALCVCLWLPSLASQLRLWLPSLAFQWDFPGPRSGEAMPISMTSPLELSVGFRGLASQLDFLSLCICLWLPSLASLLSSPVGFPGPSKLRAYAYACGFPAWLPSGISRPSKLRAFAG